MMSSNFILVLVLIGLGLLVAFSIHIYNALITLRNQLERAWSNIDVLLKQRFDEIPNLVAVVEQYAGHEANIIQGISKARQNYGAAQSPNEKIQAAQELNVALRGVVGLTENYPELKSNQNFLQLQTRISQLEESIADRREGFNEAVSIFNARIEQFPDLFLANLLGYRRQDLLRAAPIERETPKVKINIPRGA